MSDDARDDAEKPDQADRSEGEHHLADMTAAEVVADQPDDETVLDGHGVEAELLPDWRIMLNALRGRFRTGDFATGVRLVDGIGAAAEAANHHPDVDLRYGYVDVKLTSHDVGGVTMRDVRLAREISDLADGVSAKADTAALSELEIGLDTADADAVKDFWAALLGVEVQGENDDLVDPDGRLPVVWFQDTDDAPGDTPSQRFHFDLRVPPEEAERRVKAAVEAGGTMVSDARAPAFWVLADAHGNRACITTWLGRD